MKGTTNMNKANESGFTFPDNEYEVEVAEKQDKQSKNGDPMISIKLVIKKGEHAGKWVWDNIIISDNPESPGFKILGRSKHFLHCIGEPYEGENLEWDSDRWLGKRCSVITATEEPNDYHKNKKNIVQEYFLLEGENAPQDETPF